MKNLNKLCVVNDYPFPELFAFTHKEVVRWMVLIGVVGVDRIKFKREVIIESLVGNWAFWGWCEFSY